MLKIHPLTRERIFCLECKECGTHDPENTITFPEDHGRESDEALEEECKATYTHRCDSH